jgi:hypothetical protein
MNALANGIAHDEHAKKRAREDGGGGGAWVVDTQQRYAWAPQSPTIVALPRGVFRVLQDRDVAPKPFLQRVGDEFSFTAPVLDLGDAAFIERCVKSYGASGSGNFGVMLNGVKGTGKTVTAKLLCNRLAAEYALPVLYLPEMHYGFDELLASVKHDVIVMIDEIEKMIASYGNDQRILAMFDGVENGTAEQRRVFVMTSNAPTLPDGMYARPGRIRYYKSYAQISAAAIDALIAAELRDCAAHRAMVERYVNALPLRTVDVVRAVIDEVNTHGDISPHLAVYDPRTPPQVRAEQEAAATVAANTAVIASVIAKLPQ